MAGQVTVQTHFVGLILLKPEIVYGSDGFVRLHFFNDPEATQLGMSRCGCGVSVM